MRQNFRKVAAGLASCVLAMLALAGCEGSGGLDATDSDGEVLRVGIVGITADASLEIAKQHDFFERRGIQIETTVVANPAAGIAAAQSGELDIAYTPSIPYLTALSQGVQLDVIGAADGIADDALETAEDDPLRADDTGLVVSPHATDSIKRPKDLEDKTVSVSARNAQLEVTIADLVRRDGGDPERVKWMVLDPTSAIQSLEQGRIDAAGLVAPFTNKAISEGSEFLAALSVEFFEDGAVGLWVASPDVVAEKPNQIHAFHEATVEANAYANAHLDEAQEYAADVTQQSLEVVKAGARTYWPTEVRMEDIERPNRKLAELGYIPEEVDLDDDIIAIP